MPKLNGTGPRGEGPMTGRGSGFCVIPLNTTEKELNFLKTQEQTLRKQLKNVMTRMRRVSDKKE